MMKEQNIKIQKENVVQKHNDIVRHLRYKNIGFTVTERKLINYFLSKLDLNDLEMDKFPLQTFKVRDICAILKIVPDAFYEELRDITLSILSKSFEIIKPNFDGRFITSQVNWFQVCRYDMGKGTITIQFHQDLAPYVLRRNVKGKGEFVSYRLGESILMKNQYSIQWYEYLLSYLSIKNEIRMSLNNIKEFLQVGDKYTRDIDMIKACVRLPIGEVNMKSDLHIDAEEIKEKNKIVGVNVRFRMKSVDEFLNQRWRFEI